MADLFSAPFAKTVENNLVVCDAESGGSQFFHSFHALLKVKYLLALPAMKMMVMTLVGPFVSGGLAWNLYGTDLPLFDHVFDRAINCGDSQRRNAFQGQLMDFFRQ